MACGVRGLGEQRGAGSGADEESTGGRPLWEGPEELEAGSLRDRGPPWQPGSQTGGSGTREAGEGRQLKDLKPRTSTRSLGFCPKGEEAFEGRDH